MSDNCIMCGKAPGTHSFPSGMCMTPNGGTYYTAMKFPGWRTPEEVMGEKKYVVPEGGLKAACDAWTTNQLTIEGRCREVLYAFIRWQSEDPPVPTGEQVEALTQYLDGRGLTSEDYYAEWVRRMYLAPQFDPSLGGTLCGRTFTQDEADAIKDYIQMSVKPYTRA